MPVARHLLWVDSFAGAGVGVAVLVFAGWLSAVYRLPHALLLAMGAANLLYATYSFCLALRSERPRRWLRALILANAAWAGACLVIVWTFAGSLSGIGKAHLIAEAIFVGALAACEWRWRDQIVGAGRSFAPA